MQVGLRVRTRSLGRRGLNSASVPISPEIYQFTNHHHPSLLLACTHPSPHTSHTTYESHHNRLFKLSTVAMQSTRALLAQQRQPMIRFLGKRHTPSSPFPPHPTHPSRTTNNLTEVDHSPQVHPASPSASLPSSFAQYRQKAQQHGPLNPQQQAGTHNYGGFIGNKAGSQLGPVKPAEGQFFDRTELPARFQRLAWSQAEIDAIESGGASMHA